MLSIQSGASLAKSLFRWWARLASRRCVLVPGTLILVVIFKPWRLRFQKEQRLPLLLYGLSLGAMNYLFYLSIQTVPLGIAVALEFTGPLAVAPFSSRRPIDFVWVVLAVLGLWELAAAGAGRLSRRPDRRGTSSGGGSLLGGLYSHRTACRRRARPGHRGAGVSDCRHHICAAGDGAGHRVYLAVVDPAGMRRALNRAPRSLEMIALTRLPTRIFGTLMSMEPALAAMSGMVSLGRILTFTQTLALCPLPHRWGRRPPCAGRVKSKKWISKVVMILPVPLPGKIFPVCNNRHYFEISPYLLARPLKIR